MERLRYRLRKKEKNYFSKSGKTVYLDIPVTSEKLIFEKPVINISTSLINAVLVKLKGDNKPTPLKPVKKGIKIIFKSKEINLVPDDLKRDGFLLVAIFNDSKPLTTEIIEIFKGIIIDSKADYFEAIARLRTKFEFEIAQPKENDGDVIGGNG